MGEGGNREAMERKERVGEGGKRESERKGNVGNEIRKSKR